MGFAPGALPGGSRDRHTPSREPLAGGAASGSRAPPHAPGLHSARRARTHTQTHTSNCSWIYSHPSITSGCPAPFLPRVLSPPQRTQQSHPRQAHPPTHLARIPGPSGGSGRAPPPVPARTPPPSACCCSSPPAALARPLPPEARPGAAPQGLPKSPSAARRGPPRSSRQQCPPPARGRQARPRTRRAGPGRAGPAAEVGSLARRRPALRSQLRGLQRAPPAGRLAPRSLPAPRRRWGLSLSAASRTAVLRGSASKETADSGAGRARAGGGCCEVLEWPRARPLCRPAGPDNFYTASPPLGSSGKPGALSSPGFPTPRCPSAADSRLPFRKESWSSPHLHCLYPRWGGM